MLTISVNEQIQLTAADLDAVSPMRHPPTRALPLSIAVGGAETEHWIAQSRNYHALCVDRGIAADYIELPGEDHFTMTGVMGEPDKPVLQTIFRQMGLA